MFFVPYVINPLELNNMITEDYVSFETAKLLKEKGFDDFTCHSYYYKNGDIEEETRYEGDFGRPTLQMAMKWLREVHYWHIFVIPRWEDVEYMPGEWEEKMVGYQYVIVPVGDVNVKYECPTITALTPESAGEAAIRYCLENLI